VVPRSSALRLAAIALLVVVAVSAVAFLPVTQYLTDFLAWTRGLGAFAAVVIGAVYIPACIFFLPGSVITLGAGFVLGLVQGTIAVSIGSTLGAAAAFLMGRTLARDMIAQRVRGNERFGAIDRAVGEQGFKIVLLTRLSPVFPFNLLNYAYGLTDVRFRDYLLASWVGMFPGTVMYVYLGTAAKSLTEIAAGGVEGGVGGQVLLGAGLLATIVVTVVITRTARRALADAVPSDDAGSAAVTGAASATAGAGVPGEEASA
jgi:uncharacterized membrane protein YdjX (TVP38/TMEM64 family)